MSQVFYEGNLKVAADALKDPQWHAERTLEPLSEFGTRSVCIRPVSQEASREGSGWYRLDSMELICQTILRIVEQLPPEDVLVVKRRLLKLGLSGVSVSTIHRAQGSERHTVLFDPVKGASKWLCSDDGRRLINVAISRAKARLIIPLSRGDRKNVYLYFIAEMAKEDPAPACRTGLDLDEEETRQPKELSSEATPHESMTTSIQSRHENRASNNRTTVKPSPAAAFILRGIRGLLDTQQGTPIGKPRMITSTDPGFVNLYIEYLGQFRTQEPTFDNALEELDKLGLVWVRSEVHEDGQGQTKQRTIALEGPRTGGR